MNPQILINDLKMLRSIEVRCQEVGVKKCDYLKGYKVGVIDTYDLLITLMEKSEGNKGIL